MKPSDQEYYFGRCLWAQQAGASAFEGERCRGCHRDIVDIRDLTAEQFDALYREHPGRLCVRTSQEQLGSRSAWLKYATCFAVGLLPLASGCATQRGTEALSGAPAAVEQGEAVETPSDTSDVFIGIVVEEAPELIGGLEGLQERLRYPVDAQESGIEGTVFVELVVGEGGEPREITVRRGLCASCDREAIRLVESARFRPARQRGDAVAVRFSLPVRFSLNDR